MYKPITSVISIIIPAYNYAHTIDRAVSSVYKQMDNQCELLVINDGSTDNTQALLADLTTQYSRMTVVNKPNGGLASTRNTGISLAKGDYLIFLDADDEFCPDAISSIRNHLKRNPDTHFVIGGHYSINSNGKKKLHKPVTLPNAIYNRLKSYLIDKTTSISNGACVMHKSIFTDYQYPEHFRNSEDLSMFAYALVNFSCSNLDLPLANIYKHNDSLRHNVQFSEDVGLQLVEEIFHLNRIPKKLQILKNDFVVQRLLSLSRVCHTSNRHPQSTQYFIQAFKLKKSVIFKWSYFKKFMISVSKQLLISNNVN